jgi:hypothetical protein
VGVLNATQLKSVLVKISEAEAIQKDSQMNRMYPSLNLILHLEPWCELVSLGLRLMMCVMLAAG